MRFVSFNINGLRARIHQLDAIMEQLKPDVLGLQETKVHDDMFPIEIIKKYGYHVYYYGQRKYHGVALLLRRPPLSVVYGLNNTYCLSEEKRIITAQITTSIGILTVINAYFPQGKNKHSNKFLFKQQFYQNLQHYIQHTYHDHSLLLVMGDMNISPTDLDVGISEINKKKWLQLGRCAFLPEERQWITRLMNWGLIDVYRKQYPNNNARYSWFSYISNGFSKNQGLRIDLILTTQPLTYYYQWSEISYEIRSMQRPSDHAPIWTDFNIEYDDES